MLRLLYYVVKNSEILFKFPTVLIFIFESVIPLFVSSRFFGQPLYLCLPVLCYVNLSADHCNSIGYLWIYL